MGHFSARSLAFLKALKRNNKKPWFEAHRDDYEAHVKEPMAAFVRDMDREFHGFAPEIVGEPKRSMFRIHRDVRFSKDKSPYKTHAACWFFHVGGSSKVGREAHGGGAGFYFHLEPGASFMGGGIWMPPAPALKKFRIAIAEDPAGFARIVNAKAFQKRFGPLDTEASLKRVPRGYTEDHPAAAWLKLQSYVAGRPVTDAQVTSGKLVSQLAADYEVMLPLVRWLNGVLKLKA
jgi:uncharacterized protein (TIGR02453 family)